MLAFKLGVEHRLTKMLNAVEMGSMVGTVSALGMNGIAMVDGSIGWCLVSKATNTSLAGCPRTPKATNELPNKLLFANQRLSPTRFPHHSHERRSEHTQQHDAAVSRLLTNTSVLLLHLFTISHTVG